MFSLKFSGRWVVVVLLAVLIGGLALSPGSERVLQAQDVPSELVLAMIPSREASVLLPSLQPFGDLLGAALRDRGFAIDSVKAVVLTSEEATVAALGTGEVHIGFMGPLSAIQAEQESGAEIITSSVRFGNLKYKGQLMTQHRVTNLGNMDNFVERVKAGEEFTMSYTSPGSTSGFLMPCLKLKELGILPGNTPNLKTFFAGGHSSSFLAVWNGDADVGWGFDDVREGFRKRPDDTGLAPVDVANGRDEFDVWQEVIAKVSLIGYTDLIPNDPQVVAGSLPDDLKQAIKEEMVNVSHTDEGRALLLDLITATEFVGVSEDGPLTNSDFDVIRAAFNEIAPIVAQCSNS